jgi:hypothetical protein
MKHLRGRTSLTKNWPGGRRKATIIEEVGEGGSVPVWNKAIVPLITVRQKEEKPCATPSSTSSNSLK